MKRFQLIVKIQIDNKTLPELARESAHITDALNTLKRIPKENIYTFNIWDNKNKTFIFFGDSKIHLYHYNKYLRVVK